MVSTIQGTPPTAVKHIETNHAEPVLPRDIVSQTLHSADNGKSLHQKDSALKANENGKANGNTIDFKKLAGKVNQLLKDDNLAVEFSLDRETKKMIIKITDSQTKEVVNQIPPDVALTIARMVSDENFSGQVTNAKV